MVSFTHPAVAGHIRQYRLESWWFGAFTAEQRTWMGEAYPPTVEGDYALTNHSPFECLSGVALWFSKPGGMECAIAFAEKANETYSSALPVISRHFGLSNICKVFYRWRDDDPHALNSAVQACERAIAFQEKAAALLKADIGFTPAHACFRQLRIIEEKRGNYARAIEICESAKSGGWMDDWDKDIARIKKKLAR